MARRYGFNASHTAAATKTIFVLSGSSTVRPMIADIILSSIATPADNSAQYYLLRFATNAGTTTAVTPEKVDSGDSAAASLAGSNASVEPSGYGSVALLNIALNMRATVR